MNYATLAVRNLGRSRFRSIATVFGVATALVAFVLLRTVVTAWHVAADYAAQDRIAVRHKVSFTMQLPLRYFDILREQAGVEAATYANWFGGRDPRNPNDFFPTLAVEPASFLEVYNEIILTEQERADWIADRQGVIVGDVLARKLHVRVGDRVRIEGSIYPGIWEFNVRGIYTAARKSMDRSEFLFHWQFLNQSIPEARRDEIGWMIARVGNPARAADITRAIDRRFETEDVQTLAQSERAMNMSSMAMFDAILKALDWISIIIMFILLLLLGNTVAMGVRERTSEYGAMRAIGFLPKHVSGLVILEGLAMGIAAGVVGVLASYPIVQWGLGAYLEENMGGMFPYFRIEPKTTVLAFGLACTLGVVASLLPARAIQRLVVTQALKRTD